MLKSPAGLFAGDGLVAELSHRGPHSFRLDHCKHEPHIIQLGTAVAYGTLRLSGAVNIFVEVLVHAEVRPRHPEGGPHIPFRGIARGHDVGLGSAPPIPY